MGEVLRPNGVGAETALTPHPNSGEANWEDVDDVTPDDDATFVGAWGETQRDLYALPDHTASGTITSITVYFRIYGTEGSIQSKPVIRSWNSDTSAFVVTEGTGVTPTQTWTTNSQTWNTNPADGKAWEWDDIDSLQVGIAMGQSGKTSSCCTQVYVQVNTQVIQIGNETLGIKDGSEEQTIWVLVLALYNLFSRTRAAQKRTITSQEITNLAFISGGKYGSPTGDVTFCVRKVSDDSVIVSKIWGDASSWPALGTWAEVNLTPTVVNEQVRLTCEHPNNDSNNYIRIRRTATDVKADEICCVYENGAWNDMSASSDLAYRYQYTQSIIKVILKAIGARIINIGRFGVTIFRAGRE